MATPFDQFPTIYYECTDAASRLCRRLVVAEGDLIELLLPPDSYDRQVVPQAAHPGAAACTPGISPGSHGWCVGSSGTSALSGERHPERVPKKVPKRWKEQRGGLPRTPIDIARLHTSGLDLL